jgi:hypothetical protein
MQVNSSEMISIMEMKHYSKMLTDQEMMINSRLDHECRVGNGILDELIRIQTYHR